MDIYYVYEDDDHDLYYYNCKTKEATYDKPENSTLLDPKTNKPYIFPDEKEEKANIKNDDDLAKEDSDKEATPKKVKKDKKASDTESSKEIESEKEQETPKAKKTKKKSKKVKKQSDIESEPEVESKEKKKDKDKKIKQSSSQVNDDEKDEGSESGSKENAPTYFVYLDEAKNSLYYFDAQTEQTTYDKPENGIFLDPDTNELFIFDDKKNTSEEELKPKKKKSKKSDIESDNDTPKKKSKRSDIETDNETPKKKSKKSDIETDNETPKKKPKKSDIESDNDTPKKKRKGKETESSSTSGSESDSESSDDNRETYFVYCDETTKRIYYYNSQTKETTYDKPSNARFLDPSTSKTYVFEDTEKAEKKKKKVKKEKKEKKEKKDKKKDRKEKKEKKEKNQSDAEVEKDESDEQKEENQDQKEENQDQKEENQDQKEENQDQKEENQDQKEESQKEENMEPVSGSKHARFTGSMAEIPSTKKRSDTVPMKKNKSHKSVIDVDMVIDIPKEVTKFEYKPEVQRPRSQSFLPDAEKLALPANLQEDIRKFQVDDYAKQFFKEHRVHHIFSRRKISPEDLAAFQDTPLTASLLGSVPKNLQKESIQCFNLILNYSGATKDKIKNTSLTTLISLVDKNPILRDEVFFQLVKQTNNNPNEEILLRTYQIFLVCASIFPSSLDSEIWIKSHLSREAMVQKNKEIRDYAQFTYIRFQTRCTIGKPLEIAPMFVSRLAKDVYESKQVFHASIYEQLWNQRTTFKFSPVPIHVHIMADMLLQKGAEQMEGIFRIVGNKKIVTNMQEKVNKGGEIDPNIALHDLASLFKSWFSTLPDTLIPENCIPYLKTADEEKSYVEFTEKLPKAHYYTLKYLIGFFQRLVKSEEITKMNASNLAICFGPDVISTRHVKDLSDFEKFKKMSINLLTSLIENLPTNDIYPLDMGI